MSNTYRLPGTYRRDCLLGALGGLLMLVGDLCLSIVPAHTGDSGLFARAAYFDGAFESWRLQLLLATGLIGMMLGFFTVRASYVQVKPQYRKTRKVILIGGVGYIASACVIHLWIGTLADWTGRLAPLLGREQTLTLVQAQYSSLMPVMLIAYVGMILLMIGIAFAVLTGKTVLPRWMFAFHLIVWQLLFAGIPDIRQLLGAEISTWDFVLSQASGNAALVIWMVANTIWAGKHADSVWE